MRLNWNRLAQGALLLGALCCVSCRTAKSVVAAMEV